jgi:hypothetical protein
MIRVSTYRLTDSWEEFMKYAVEMGSGAMIRTPNFVKIGSGIQKLIMGGYRVSLLQFFFFFKIRICRLKVFLLERQPGENYFVHACMGLNPSQIFSPHCLLIRKGVRL